MNTQIEDFIKEHKKEFDTDRPSGNLWDRIEKELDEKKPKKRFNIQLWMSIAASAVVLLAVTFFVALPVKKNKISIAAVF